MLAWRSHRGSRRWTVPRPDHAPSPGIANATTGSTTSEPATAVGVSGAEGALGLRVVVIFGVFWAAMPAAGLLLGQSVASDLASRVNRLSANQWIAPVAHQPNMAVAVVAPSGETS